MVYIQEGLGGICMQASCVSYMHHIRHPHETHLQGALHQDPGFLVLMMLCRIYKKNKHYNAIPTYTVWSKSFRTDFF
jgi:hypothetical protein